MKLFGVIALNEFFHLRWRGRSCQTRADLKSSCSFCCSLSSRAAVPSLDSPGIVTDSSRLIEKRTSFIQYKVCTYLPTGIYIKLIFVLGRISAHIVKTALGGPKRAQVFSLYTEQTKVSTACLGTNIVYSVLFDVCKSRLNLYLGH